MIRTRCMCCPDEEAMIDKKISQFGSEKVCFLFLFWNLVRQVWYRVWERVEFIEFLTH
jgi:hypothetical protein